MAIPQTGDAVPLFQTLMSATWYGVVGDGNTPGGMAATLEMVDDEAVITTDVLVGPKGDPGNPAPIVQLQWPAFEQVADLETVRDDLTLDDAGKAWWIGSVVYVWDGTDFQSVRPGPAGPPGITPQISFSAETIPMSERTSSSTDEVIQSGSSTAPHIHLRLLSPQGPQGPSTNITAAPDYYSAGGAPDDGQTLVWNETLGKWKPSDFTAKHPRLYSIPQQAFNNFSGSNPRHPILTYTIEAQDYDWVPYVTGHIKAFGIELDADPFIIGCEVRLGGADDTGPLIGRGWGNISNWTTIVPHFSTSADPTAAVSPDNATAMVYAGQEATITLWLSNDGLFGAYVFNRSGAQLSILTIPQGE